MRESAAYAAALFIKRRIEGVEVFRVELVGRDAQAFAEALVVHDLSFAQELDGVAHVGVIGEPQDVVVRDAGFLLGGEVLVQIGERVPGDGKGRGAERYAGCRDGVYAGGVVDKVGVESLLIDLLGGEVSCELVDDGADHLEVGELFGAYIGMLIDYLAFLWYNIENYSAIKEFSYVYREKDYKRNLRKIRQRLFRPFER